MIESKDAFEAARRATAKRLGAAAAWQDRVAAYQALEAEHIARALDLYRQLGGPGDSPAVAEVAACAASSARPARIAFPDAVAILAADLAELP